MSSGDGDGGLDQATAWDAGNGQVGQVEAALDRAVTVAASPTGLAEVAGVDDDVDVEAVDVLVGAGSPGGGDGRLPRLGALVRAMEAVRAASAAADSTAAWVVAVRPPKMISPTNSTNAGTPMTASMAAEPRSSRCLDAASSRRGQPLHGTDARLDDHRVSSRGSR